MIDQSATEVIEEEFFATGFVSRSSAIILYKDIETNTLDKLATYSTAGGYSLITAKERCSYELKAGFYTTVGKMHGQIQYIGNVSEYTPIPVVEVTSSDFRGSSSVTGIMEEGDTLKIWSSADVPDHPLNTMHVKLTAYETGVLVKTGGAKEYDLTVTGTNFSNTESRGTFYKDIDDKWRVRFNIHGGLTGSTSLLSLHIAGVTFAGGTYKPVDGILWGGAAGSRQYSIAYPSSDQIDIGMTASNAYGFAAAFGDVALAEKPSFVTDYTQDVHGHVKTAVIYEPVIIEDVKPQGTKGGTSVSGWQDRTLNTITGGSNSNVALAGDNVGVILQKGTYKIRFLAPTFKTGAALAALYVDGVERKLSQSQYNSAAVDTSVISQGDDVITLTSQATLKIRSYTASGTANNGLGENSGGTKEHYSRLVIEQLPETGFIASSKEEIYKHVDNNSPFEQVLGKVWNSAGTQWKPKYERTIYFDSDVTSSTSTYLNVGTGLAPINSINYSSDKWILSLYRDSTDQASVYYDKGTGMISVSIVNIKIGAGTTIPFQYTKDSDSWN